MAAQNGTLKNNGNDVYPKTLEMNVYDGNGNRLDQKLAQMSSDLSNKEITVTKNTSVVSSNSAVRCFRCANIVFVAFDINVLSGAAVDSVIATDLPTAINPGAVGRTTKGFDVFVTTDGKLQIQSTPSTGWAKGSVTYMT